MRDVIAPLCACLLGLGAWGCDDGATGTPAAEVAPAAEAAPAAPAPEPEPETAQGATAGGDYPPSPSSDGVDGSELFGAIPGSAQEVELASLIAKPQAHAGAFVRTRGVVSRVCKKAGCWLEIRTADDQRLRAPMAGHALAIPQRVMGKQVEVAGEVFVRELSEEQKAHYRAEGMTATEGVASLEATGVRVLP